MKQSCDDSSLSIAPILVSILEYIHPTSPHTRTRTILDLDTPAFRHLVCTRRIAPRTRVLTLCPVLQSQPSLARCPAPACQHPHSANPNGPGLCLSNLSNWSPTALHRLATPVCHASLLQFSLVQASPTRQPPSPPAEAHAPQSAPPSLGSSTSPSPFPFRSGSHGLPSPVLSTGIVFICRLLLFFLPSSSSARPPTRPAPIPQSVLPGVRRHPWHRLTRAPSTPEPPTGIAPALLVLATPRPATDPVFLSHATGDLQS